MKSTECVKNNDFAKPENAFIKYADMVYRLVFVRTKSKADSDDILQEVFLRYMKIWQKIETEEHLKAMLLRITVNCTNSLKTSFWFKHTEQLDENISVTDNVSETNVISEVLKLPIKYRTVIHLHYYCGYSVEEIANIENTKPSTVKTHLYRARQILKSNLKEEI